MGHYKNSLSRRKRSTDDDFAKNGVNSSTVASNDSQTAAIIVTQVTGSHPNDDEAILITEPPQPVDQSDETSPQTFRPKLAEKSYFDYDEEEQVSRQQRENKEEPGDYNSEKFIADENDDDDDDDDESKEEEVESSAGLSAELVEHGKQENTDNEGLAGEQELGQPDSVDEKNSDSGGDLDDSNEEEPDRAGAADSDGDGGKRDEAVPGRGIEDYRESLDWINNYYGQLTDKQDLNGDNESRASGNLKEQFEHIPLDYKHDDVQEKQQKEDDETEKYTFPFHIDLGDTTVELDNITLPESVFGLYKSEFTDEQPKNEKNAKIEEESNSDKGDEKNEDDEEEEEKEDDSENNDSSEKDEPKKQNDDFIVTPYKLLGYENDFVPPYADFDAKRKEDIKDYSKEEDQEYLHDYIGDPNLRGAVAALLEKSKKTESEAGSEDDPKYSYSWTLEYGQPS